MWVNKLSQILFFELTIPVQVILSALHCSKTICFFSSVKQYKNILMSFPDLQDLMVSAKYTQKKKVKPT